MRNLKQYPVTWTEKIEFLQKLYDDNLESFKTTIDHPVGDMTCVIIHEIMEDVKELDSIHMLIDQR